MVNISRKTYERNGIETIVDNDGILWLNEKHILQEITTKYHADHRKHRHGLGLDNKSKKQCN